jgi:hypothetical protein
MVPPKMQAAANLMYEALGANIILDVQPFAHQFPSDLPHDFRPFQECGDPKYYYPNCGYDSAGKILSHLLLNMTGSTTTQLNPRDDDW